MMGAVFGKRRKGPAGKVDPGAVSATPPKLPHARPRPDESGSDSLADSSESPSAVTHKYALVSCGFGVKLTLTSSTRTRALFQPGRRLPLRCRGIPTIHCGTIGRIGGTGPVPQSANPPSTDQGCPSSRSDERNPSRKVAGRGFGGPGR